MGRLRLFRLSVKVTVLVVLAVLLTAAAGAAAAIVIGRRVLTASELQDSRDRLEVYAAALSLYVDSARSVLETTARFPEMEGLALSLSHPAGAPDRHRESAARKLANLVLENSRTFEQVMLLRPDGSVLVLEPRALESKMSHSNLSFQAWHRELLRAKRTVISDLVISPATQSPTVIIATPVWSAGGKLIGIWGGALRLGELSAIGSVARQGAPRGDYGYVTDRRGLMIAHQAKLHYVEQQTDFSSVPAVGAALAGGRGVGQFVNPIEEEEVLGAWMPLRDLGWPVVHLTPSRIAFEPLDKLNQGTLATTLGVVLVMGSMGVLAARRITGPISRLTAAARTMGTGDFSERISVGTRDEIGGLADAFNGMAEKLSNSQARLRADAEDLARTAEERSRAIRDLEAANKELEAFSYSVSHDLRAPLRAIDGFTRILVEEHAAHLPAEAQRRLQIVRDNTRHMGQLVDDLLAFSRLGRQPLVTRRVAPGEVAREAWDKLAPTLAGRRVEIAIGELPPCEGDPALLRQLFVNLLENALKFTRTREIARIEIGAADAVSGEQAYFVRDNGVGFDMRYAHKLFGVFQRLHRADEYEGTGVGLAIVQRVVHRHGGRVWAEAEVGRGATFHFTLQGGSGDDA